MSKIKFVYFDVGGVVIRDFSGTNKHEELEQELGITKEQSKDFWELWDSYEGDLCKGKDLEELLPLMRKAFKIQVSQKYSLLHDGVVGRFERNESIWPIIEEIQKTSRVGLLTNMYPRLLDAIKEKGLLPDIEWDVIVDSSLEGTQKPEPRIFEIAEERSGARGSDIFFIDNSLKNVEGAKKFGWGVFHYDSKNPEKSSRELMEYWRKIK